jgi:uncharacterized protein YhaN
MSDELRSLITEYRAGLDAELALLRQLDLLAARVQEATHTGDYATLRSLHEARDTIMGHLVAVEHELKPLRGVLAEQRHLLQRLPDFQAVAALHIEATEMVNQIIASDHESLAALQKAEHARRAAVMATERGETTLQAYRRVIAPAPNATLVDRRG